VTNQPDWGDVYIHIKGEKAVTPESLLQYIVSMRKENHFHEEIAECIYKRLFDLLQPEELFVACLYTRRGGIDINPVRASNNRVLYKYGNIADVTNFCTKTARQ
jgi:7-cyano-7-deazaguanine reductase